MASGGLQVKPRGAVTGRMCRMSTGAYVVNIGDCLTRWTNDIYVSTPHRVLPPKRQRTLGRGCSWRPTQTWVVEALPGHGRPEIPLDPGRRLPAVAPRCDL